jgi:cardiolipin synthase
MSDIKTSYPELWESFLNDCKNAKNFIYFEEYILQSFGEGEIGHDFLKVFMQKAKEGVEVKLILDALGSFTLYTNPILQAELRDSGIQLEFFNIVPKWKAIFPFNIIHRDHRKLLIIDDTVAHVGGVVVWEKSRNWKDINARIQDPLYVKELKGAFLRMWDEIREERAYEKEYDTNEQIIIKTDPENNELYKEIFKRIKEAHSKIVIVTPYFSPDAKILKALTRACKRGVVVDIIIPEKCDSKLSSMVTASYIRQLQRHKINTHFYCDCMNHGKLVLIDEWVTLGSMNFDRLSFFYNRELNIVLNEDISHVEKLIVDMKSRSTKVDSQYFKKMTMFEKFLVRIGKLLRPFA